VTEEPATRAPQAPQATQTPAPAHGEGPGPDRPPQGDTGPRVPRCSVTDRYSTRRCPKPAAHRVILGCVHEHMLCGFTCADHIEAIRGEQLVTCGRCSDGPDPHECPTLGREATREEQKKVIAHA
jgi:hypothetical protein